MDKMISDEYLKLNAELHKKSAHFGSSAWRCWKDWINVFLADHDPDNKATILDYGCGKATVSKEGPYTVTNYDPAIPEYAAEPEPHDLVLCIDVMEHVEEQHVDKVLDHLASLTGRALFIVISVRCACATLPDGRNAHITVKPQGWWMRKLMDRFRSLKVVTEKELDHFAVVCHNGDSHDARG